MAEFLVELYVSRADASAVQVGVGRARLAEELTRAGTPVRYLRSIFVPEDELCFLMFEAGSMQDVCEAARRVQLPFERISEVRTSVS